MTIHSASIAGRPQLPQHRPGAPVVGGQQDLLIPLLVLLDDLQRHVENGLGRSVVLLERHFVRARVVLQQPVEIPNLGRPPPVDALVGSPTMVIRCWLWASSLMSSYWTPLVSWYSSMSTACTLATQDGAPLEELNALDQEVVVVEQAGPLEMALVLAVACFQLLGRLGGLSAARSLGPADRSRCLSPSSC